MSTHEKMLVMGAGPVGLAQAKALKENGIAYDHVEADDRLGGNWWHGVYDSAHIISSRQTTEFPDFPMPDHYPDFPSRLQMLEYLNSYADHFDLASRIRFNTKVTRVRPAEDDLWEVSFEDGGSSTYKGVLVCNGHHWDRRWPDYPGEFTGEYIHSKDYKTSEQIRGKRVLVIGGGNSACDVVSEAARLGASADLSLRNGIWFLPKTVMGRPIVQFMKPWVPLWLERLMVKMILRFVVGRYADYGLPEPNHRLWEKHPTISSEVLYYLKQGRIRPRPGVRRFDGSFVEFVDGRREEYDLVVAATGYHVSFPFLPRGLVEIKGAVPQVYGLAALPDYRGLYLVGWMQPRYGFGPLATPAADLMAKVVKLQDEVDYPVGHLVRRLGKGIPDTHLFGPHQFLREVWLGSRSLWLLRLLSKIIRDPVRPNTPLEPALDNRLGTAPLKVY